MTLHPYFPLVPGSSIKYAVFDNVEGQFDPRSGQFGVTSKTPHANSPQVLSCVESGNIRLMVYHPPHRGPDITVDGVLGEARFGKHVGEVGGKFACQLPGIPLLSDDMRIGAKIDGTLPVMRFDANGNPLWQSDYYFQRYVLHMGQPWGPPWPDTIRTTILENHPSEVQFVIGYVFAKGKGIVNFWTGFLEANPDPATGIVKTWGGVMYYAIG